MSSELLSIAIIGRCLNELHCTAHVEGPNGLTNTASALSTRVAASPLAIAATRMTCKQRMIRTASDFRDGHGCLFRPICVFMLNRWCGVCTAPCPSVKRPAHMECYNFLYYFKSVGSTTLPTYICPSRRAMDRCT